MKNTTTTPAKGTTKPVTKRTETISASISAQVAAAAKAAALENSESFSSFIRRSLQATMAAD